MELVRLENHVKIYSTKYEKYKKIIVFSRDELKQHEMKNEIKSNKVRYTGILEILID